MDSLRSEAGDDEFHHCFGDFRPTAGENIDCRVAVLRPSVDGDVAFRDHDHTADTLWREVMEMGRYQRGSAFLGAVAEAFLQACGIVQDHSRAAGQLGKDMPAGWRGARCGLKHHDRSAWAGGSKLGLESIELGLHVGASGAGSQ